MSFKASPNTFSNLGGNVKLTAGLKFATRCTLSVSPSVKGLPERNFSCGGKTLSKSFAIGKNATPNPLTYTFHLSVKNKEGNATAPNVVVAEGAAPPPISFGIKGKNFGTVGVLIHSKTVGVQVTNNSVKPQGLGSFTVVGINASDFAVPSNDCAGIVLSPRGGECSFEVDFVPTSTGRRVATLELADQSWGSSGTNAGLPLSGTGVFSQISISASSQFYEGGSINFGVQGVGTATAPDYITISDQSPTVSLYVSSIGVSGQNYTDFGVGAGNCGQTVIDPGAECQFTVYFVPSGSGLRKDEVDVYGNMSGGVWAIPESGTGAYASLTLDSPPGIPITSIAFGSTKDNPVAVPVTVTNTSSKVFLAFSGASAVSGPNAPDFTWLPGSCAYPGAELGPSQSCTFNVIFQPQVQGIFYQAEFSLFDNAQSASETLSLTGQWTSS
jgi:hypothetical protein